MSGRVYLVGAGCGGPELLTLRAAELLRACSCVVYDDLIDPAILDLAPPEAERVYMGKRSGRHSAPQAEINALLIEKARAGDVVVRLKGGDPFVFGRGGEEMLALAAAGVVCEAVPGISSAIAIPELAGIPLTHRGLSRSFHVVTAHSAATGDTLPEHLDALARTGGTLVFLMGLTALGELSRRLIAAGMSPDTPAAVVSGGNSPHPADVRGTLADIAERAAKVEAPAVIVVGAVAELSLAEASLPLSGVRVALTGTDAVQSKLRACFPPRGRGCSPRRAAGGRWRRGSRRGSTARLGRAHERERRGGILRRLAAEGFDLRRLGSRRFAVIGRATGAALRAHGIIPDLCPERQTSAGLAEALLETAEPGADVRLYRSALAARELPEALAGRFSVTDTPIYTVETRLVSDAAADYVVFSSAGGARAYLAAGGKTGGAVCVSIGPVTTAALREFALPTLESPDISAEGILTAVLKHRAARLKVSRPPFKGGVQAAKLGRAPQSAELSLCLFELRGAKGNPRRGSLDENSNARSASRFGAVFLRARTAEERRNSIWPFMERKSSSAQAAISSQSVGEICSSTCFFAPSFAFMARSRPLSPAPAPL
ncbi:MAG: uroporphyrinogen-III C-methyltransferase [Oscillospiraceae bacterium]